MTFLRDNPNQNPFILVNLSYLHQPTLIRNAACRCSQWFAIPTSTRLRPRGPQRGETTITIVARSWPKLTCDGDLQANILISSKYRACLADFGLAAIVEDASSIDGPPTYRAGGTIRWMAPEILDPDRYGYIKRARRKLPSKSTDIYALGMTILEVGMGSPLLLLLLDASYPL